MWMVNENVKPVKDCFKITEVDCFTKPHAIVLNSLVPGMYDSFIFEVALAKSYGFHHGLTENRDWSFGIHPYIIKRLGFDYHVHYSETISELEGKIKKELDQGTPVLLPGNLHSVCYSWAYQKIHALHLFVIHGYDKKTGVYTVIDNLQNMKNPIPVFKDISGEFTNFNIRPGELCQSWKELKYLEFPYFNYRYITIGRGGSHLKPLTAMEKIKDYTRLLDMDATPWRFREIYCFQEIITYLKHSKKKVEKELRHFQMEMIYGNKVTILNLVFQLVQQITTDNRAILKKLNLHKEDIIKGWNKILVIFYARLYKRSIEHVQELEYLYNGLIQKEREFMNEVKNITERSHIHDK